MAVCLARSLAARGRLDLDDVGRRYVAWTAEAFDIGNQTRSALQRIAAGELASTAGLATWHASDRRAAGNGSLMRTTPIAIAYAGEEGTALIEAAIAESLITHADPRCVLACAAFDAAIAAAITRGIDGRAMVEVGRGALELATEHLAAAWAASAPADHTLIASARRELASDLDAALADDPDVYGSELHVHRTAGFVRLAFRLAFWHAAHTPSWETALIDVASRGGDADTNGAIVGALLGARDGDAAIPEAWRERVLLAVQPGSATWAEAHHPRHLLALA